MKWLVGLLQKTFYYRYLNFFGFVLFVWLIFLIIKLLGILKLLLEIFFLEHLSELAFRLLCHVMYQKCTCSIFINFLNGLNDVLKKVLCKWGAFICEGLSFFQNFFIWTGLQTDWRHSISNSFKQIRFNWNNS